MPVHLAPLLFLPFHRSRVRNDFVNWGINSHCSTRQPGFGAQLFIEVVLESSCPAPENLGLLGNYRTLFWYKEAPGAMGGWAQGLPWVEATPALVQLANCQGYPEEVPRVHFGEITCENSCTPGHRQPGRQGALGLLAISGGSQVEGTAGTGRSSRLQEVLLPSYCGPPLQFLFY